MNGGELLKRSHSAESEHRPLPSSKWQVRVLGSVVEPAPRFLSICGTNIPQCSTVGPKSICDDYLGLSVLSHRLLEEFQCGFLVACLGDEAFQDLPFVVHRAPQVVPLAVDLHEHLVEMPLPVARSHPVDPALLDLTGEHRAKPMPPKSNSFVADIDAALVKQILDVSQREREPNVEHHREADDLGAGLEVLERGAFGHPKTLAGAAPSLKASSFDRTW